jgi:hypothetical protein
VHQSYLRDYRALKMTPVDDGFVEFGAAPATRPTDELTLAAS